jgi:hypothetical protein
LSLLFSKLTFLILTNLIVCLVFMHCVPPPPSPLPLAPIKGDDFAIDIITDSVRPSLSFPLLSLEASSLQREREK